MNEGSTRPLLGPFLAVAVAAVAVAACASRSTTTSAGTTLVSTTAAATTSSSAAVPAASTTTLAASTTTNPASATPGPATATTAGSGVPVFEDPATWTVLGRSSAGDALIEVRAFDQAEGRPCVAVGVLDGRLPPALLTSCQSLAQPGVRQVADRLVVSGVVGSGDRVRLASTSGDITVETWPWGSGRAYAAVLPEGDELLAVDGATAPASCPYRLLAAAVEATGATEPSPSISVLDCVAGAAGVEINSSHVGPQGAGAVAVRDGDGFRVLALGSLLCEPGSMSLEEEQACTSIGWPR